MKKVLTGIVIFCAVAFTTQCLFIKYIPNLVFRIAVRRTGHNFNHWVNAPKTDANMRKVVMPNPDFVYSALFYDVKDSDILVSGVLPDSAYGSVSFYDDRCQPYYVYNNLSPERKGAFTLHLSKEGRGGVYAKTQQGVIICRFLLISDSSYQQMVGYQRELRCDEK